ncbi:MAG: biotin--[acetyl-CoA-carboxylase] ligase [Desulfobacteraceae bacterium]|jgi:BirA family biotin operon repressor/biotin-[acetyl-CoA-carboxylase] ligase|nr:biotin--[acetyl-CoA-carboxylase] ligase [Desulfobacteraceae bacterium]
MKTRILHMLRGQSEPVSGETLSTRLGVSRVAVWKHLQKLQALGYSIESTAKGYRLVDVPDKLYPWEFNGWENRIVHHESLDSTMETARRLAHDDCPAFTVVIAEAQTVGRGRLRRTWVSEAGGIYFTMVLRPALPPQLAFRVNFAASTVLARVLRRRYEVDARVKWPNDILIDGRKVCGLLAEMEAEADAVRFVNIGIGLNANNDPPPVPTGAVSLRQALGRRVSRRNLLADFLDAFKARMEAGTLENAVAEWRPYAISMGRRVRVATGRETLEGTAVDVDDNGALILALADGTRRAVIYGDCFLSPD